MLLHSYWGGRIIDNRQIDNQNLQIDNLQMTGYQFVGYQFVGNQFVENWSGYLFPGITSSLGTPKKERKKKEWDQNEKIAWTAVNKNGKIWVY